MAIFHSYVKLPEGRPQNRHVYGKNMIKIRGNSGQKHGKLGWKLQIHHGISLDKHQQPSWGYGISDTWGHTPTNMGLMAYYHPIVYPSKSSYFCTPKCGKFRQKSPIVDP